MTQWADFWPICTRQHTLVDPIHMGDGRFLSAEDVLESHFHRLQTKTVQVQVRKDLQSAITVLAPTLAPLTELAEEVAQAVPLVQPAPRFRQDLHKALEMTHRQQSAQRKLGTRPQPAKTSPSWATISTLLALVVLLGALALFHRRSQHMCNG